MNIKKILKFGLPLIGATAIAVSLPLALTSCSKNESSKLNVKTFDALVKSDESDVNLYRNTIKQTGDTAHYITSPSLNRNALELAKETFKNISKSQLQKDFDFAITRIYDAYEFEQENSFKRDDDEELEASIEYIKVVDKYSNDPSGLTWIVDVTYEVEKDDDEIEVIQRRLFTITPEFATQSYIEGLKKYLKGEDIQHGSDEVELDDLYEFYFGDKDDIDDLDDVGIFDLMNLYRKQYNSKDGSLLGYSIDLLAFKPYLTENGADIVSDDYTQQDAEKLNKKDAINQQEVKLFTPSISNNYFFYANESNMPKFNGQRINLLLDENKLKQLTKEEFERLINEWPYINLLTTGNKIISEGNNKTPIEKSIDYINLLMKTNSSLVKLDASMFGTNGSITVTSNESGKDYVTLTYDFGDKQTQEHYSKIHFYLDKNLFKESATSTIK